jgi:hypothetical protein
MKPEISREIFEKGSNKKSHQNPPSRSRVVPCGQTEGRTDMTKLIIAFRNLAIAPGNYAPVSNNLSFFLCYES